jgi:hypothetical protein
MLDGPVVRDGVDQPERPKGEPGRMTELFRFVGTSGSRAGGDGQCAQKANTCAVVSVDALDGGPVV